MAMMISLCENTWLSSSDSRSPNLSVSELKLRPHRAIQKSQIGVPTGKHWPKLHAARLLVTDNMEWDLVPSFFGKISLMSPVQ